MSSTVYYDPQFTWGTPQTKTQTFVEGYSHAVSARSFGDSITKWYGPSFVFHSETGTVFRGPHEMLEWMREIFFSFERVDHVAKEYIELPLDDGFVKVFARFHRQLWLKGNTSDEPDISTPMAFVLTLGPAETDQGYLGLQLHEVHLFWDKTKTVRLLQKNLPSD